MRPGDLVIADASGNKVSGAGKVSSEFFTHLAAYEERPDITAVVHAHPPVATALTLAGVSMAEPILPELVMALGGVPVAAYATPGTGEGAEVVRAPLRQCDAIMLDRHGALTVGAGLMEAYFKMEKLEHAALTLYHARALGKAPPLDASQLERIALAREAYGATGRTLPPA